MSPAGCCLWAKHTGCCLCNSFQLPEKLAVLQLIKKSPTFYGTRSIITMFTSTCPCPEPEHPAPVSSSPFFKIHFNIVFPCMHLVCLPYLLHDPPISFFLIWSPKNYSVRNTGHKAPNYVIFSTPLTQAQISFSAPCSCTLSAYVPPWMWETKFHTQVKQQPKL